MHISEDGHRGFASKLFSWWENSEASSDAGIHTMIRSALCGWAYINLAVLEMLNKVPNIKPPHY